MRQQYEKLRDIEHLTARKLKSFHDGNDLAAKVKLAYFLNGQHPERMRMILQAFDETSRGSINQQEFSVGLELMGYQSVSDYKDLFLMLDSEGHKELELEWLEAHLKSLVDE